MAAIQCDRDTFLRNLQQSNLLSPREFRKAVDHLPESDRGRVVAKALVEAGTLTRFQAELLLVGRTQGFYLGQYRILDQIGQGGMGRVFKAMHLTMKRVVALKVLAPQLVQTTKALKLFKREVRAAAQLQHPNIVTAYDANQIKDRHYLVMEFVDGPNLDQLVRQKGPLPVGLACEVIRQAASGLQYAHEMGLVHRDIKPANLLLQKPKRAGTKFTVKILDFGLARLHDQAGDGEKPGSIVKDHTVMGTPDFLSPEQSRNLPVVDTRSDIYSLGCTLYFLLTGRVPFPGGPTLEKLLRHSTEDPLTVALFRSDVPPDVLAVVNKMLAKKPEDRFQTPQEVVEALSPSANPTGADLDMKDTTPPFSTASSPNVDIAEKPKIDTVAGDSQAVQGTIPPDLAPTPISEEVLFPFWAQEHPSKRLFGYPAWVVVATAVALLGLTIAGIVMMWPS